MTTCSDTVRTVGPPTRSPHHILCIARRKIIDHSSAFGIETRVQRRLFPLSSRRADCLHPSSLDGTDFAHSARRKACPAHHDKGSCELGGLPRLADRVKKGRYRYLESAQWRKGHAKYRLRRPDLGCKKESLGEYGIVDLSSC